MGQIILSDENGKPKKFFYRRDKSHFKPAQLKFLYENFVIRCENDVSSLKYFYINSKEIKLLKKNLKFDIKPLKPSQEHEVILSADEFVFLNDKRSAIASLLFHIRNSFVHNRIWVLDSGEIEMVDTVPPTHMKKKDIKKMKQKGKRKPQTRVTMYAKVSSYYKLHLILQGIINSQQ